jgi:outer membrane protein assembly factor BamA
MQPLFLNMHIILIFIIYFASACFAQERENNNSEFYPFVVDSIKIIGNDITEEDIITRELNFFTGDSITYEQMQFNGERVYSLGLFNRVDLYTSVDSGKIYW